MRFFSNDSRQASDDQARVDDTPERVQSEPVPVPQQRPPSPWAATPANHPDDADDRSDQPAGQGGTGEVAAGDRPPSHQDHTDDDLDGTDTAHRSWSADGAPQHVGAHAGTAVDDRPGGAGRTGPSDDVIDVPLEDGGTFEDPVVVEPGGDARTFAGSAPVASPADSPGLDPAADRHRHPDDDDDEDDDTDGDRRDADHRLSGPTDSEVTRSDLAAGSAVTAGAALGPVVTHTDSAETSAVPGPAPTAGASATGPADVAASVPPAQRAAAPVEQLPGTVAAPELGPLFADSDAHAFRDRWRDVQLRFVDDPKAAADDAATLVDEAVDALAASLRKQKGQLNDAAENTSNDTEQLRVRIRGYRDFLDRLLDL